MNIISGDMNIIKWDTTIIMHCPIYRPLRSQWKVTQRSFLYVAGEGKVAKATDVELRMCILDLCNLNLKRYQLPSTQGNYVIGILRLDF